MVLLHECGAGPDELCLNNYKVAATLPAVKTDPVQLLKFHKIVINCTNYQPFYFPLEKNGKEPTRGISWKNNRKTFSEAYYLMRRGFNIGICATGHDCLCIVDIDDLTQVPSIKPTLQVTSRKRIGLHNYFFAKDGTAKKNITTGDAGEVRAIWQYVLAPGSYVTCSEEEISRMPENEKQYAGRYTLNNELPINEITFEELPDVYKLRHAEMKHDEIEAAIRDVNRKVKSPTKNQNSKYRSAIWDLDITNVSGMRDTASKRVPMPSDIHGSDSGHNCSVSDGLLHCWRHETAHNAFSYMAMLVGIRSCERAGRPHGGRSFGVDFQDGYTILEVWKYAKNAGIIPENDPIPPAALSHYAIQKGICKKQDLIDGYRLPDIAYRLALLVSKREGLNFGRN
jgi:putative DNA primase/helicase